MRFLAPLAAVLLAIPLGSIKPHAHAAPETPSWVHNRVLDIRGDTVRIGLGTNDFLQGGEEYFVFRGSEYIATIEVDAVFQRHALAHSIEDPESSPIHVGDKLVFPIVSPVEPDFDVR